MARPTQPKDVKAKTLEPVPDAGGEETPKAPLQIPGLNMIIMAVIIILCTSLSSAASMYFLAPLIIKPLISHAGSGEGDNNAAGGGEEGGKAPEQSSVGPVLTLDEFTVNLKDPGKERYLRADLSITLTANDPKFEKLAGEALKKWQEEFKIEMGAYVPSIRDIVISSLTKRTAVELSTAIGKQEVKDEIKKNVDALLQGKRQVIRVNLENFIIQ